MLRDVYRTGVLPVVKMGSGSSTTVSAKKGEIERAVAKGRSQIPKNQKQSAEKLEFFSRGGEESCLKLADEGWVLNS